MAPCEKSRIVIGVAVPNPTWVVPRPAPSDCVTRSLKLISLALKPVEFMLARLLPTTSMAVEVALSAESAVENDVNIDSLRSGYPPAAGVLLLLAALAALEEAVSDAAIESTP